MHASRTLPDGYVLGGTVTLAGNRRLRTRLLLLSLPWTLLCLYGIGAYAAVLRPEGWTLSVTGLALALVLLGLLATLPVMLLVHEGVHALALWALTRARPVFGWRGWYAYTDSPGWFLSRPAMVVALAAPLVVVPLLAAPVVASAPGGVALAILLLVLVNAVGALGDLYLIGVAVRVRGPVLFGDDPGGRTGDGGGWYVPS
jgi:Putative zincin peptidase